MDKLRKIIDLNNSRNCNWPKFIEFSKKSPPKVISVSEIIDDIALTALSSNLELMACVQDKNGCVKLFVIDFIKQKYYFIWEFSYAIHAIKFVVGSGNVLVVASQCGKVFFIDIIEGEMQIFEDHSAVPIGIGCNSSNLIVTWSKKDALLWPTPVKTLKSKLRVNSEENIVWVCHVWKSSSFVAGFDSGTVMIWDELDDMQEYAVTVKEERGIYNSYTVSSDGECIVGGGSLPYLNVYSISSRKVIGTIEIHSLCPTVTFCQFMPTVHHHYPKVLLLLSAEGTVVMYDFSNRQKIKSLKSQNYFIRDICVSDGGQFIAITYDKGHTKIYSTLSFFPPVKAPRSKSCDKMVTDFGDECQKSSTDDDVLKHSTLNASKSMTSIHCELEHSKTATKKSKVPLSKSQWLKIVAEFGKFPQKYRRIIWTRILELPLNTSVVSGLIRKEMHPAVDVFRNSAQLTDNLSSTLNCLLYWAPGLASVHFLADFIKNFVLLFKDYYVHCFELCATVIFNWCRTWFECWPEPPIAIMHIIEQVICDNDPELLVHLMKLKIYPEMYAWSLLSTGFSKVVSMQDYLIIWDNILANPPSYILCVAASFNLCLKKSILSCSTHSEAKQLYQQESWLLPTVLLRKSSEIYTKLKINEEHRKLLDRIEYLPKGGLPPFSLKNHKLVSKAENDIRNSEMKSEQAVGSSLLKKPLHSTVGPNSSEDYMHKINNLRRKQVRRHLH